MLISEIQKRLESIAPFSLAEEWDNIGLLAGDPALSADRAVVALDITQECINYAQKQGAELIIAHHPVIFKPLKRITTDMPVFPLIESGMAAICLHTNLDACEQGLAAAVGRLMGLCNPRSLGSPPAGVVGERSITLGGLARECLSLFGAGGVRFTGDAEMPVSVVAVVPGAGGDFLSDAKKAGADCFVTGELKHSDMLSALIPVIEIGHGAMENALMREVFPVIRDALPGVTLSFYDQSDRYSYLVR